MALIEGLQPLFGQKKSSHEFSSRAYTTLKIKTGILQLMDKALRACPCEGGGAALGPSPKAGIALMAGFEACGCDFGP